MVNDLAVLASELAVPVSEPIVLASDRAGPIGELTTLASERTYKQVANDVGQ